MTTNHLHYILSATAILAGISLANFLVPNHTDGFKGVIR